MMEQSIFKVLVDQYQTPHPLLGVDGQAFPMIPYSMKLEMLQNGEAFQGLTMDDFVNAETRRVMQLLNAANAKGDTQLATRILNELYPLMVEDVQSGNPIAVQVYSPVVNQIQAIIAATQQPQSAPQDPQEKAVASKSPIADAEEPVSAVPVDAEPKAPTGKGEEPVSAASADTEPKSVPVGNRGKKRTPASSIVLIILGIAFMLAFLLINALPFIGVGTFEELEISGLLDIGRLCLILGAVCIVIGLLIKWRSSRSKR